MHKYKEKRPEPNKLTANISIFDQLKNYADKIFQSAFYLALFKDERLNSVFIYLPCFFMK